MNNRVVEKLVDKSETPGAMRWMRMVEKMVDKILPQKNMVPHPVSSSSTGNHTAPVVDPPKALDFPRTQIALNTANILNFMFDLDNTLVETEHTHFNLYKQLFAEILEKGQANPEVDTDSGSGQLSEAWHENAGLKGKSTKTYFDKFLKADLENRDKLIEEYKMRKDQNFQNLIRDGHFTKPVDGVLELFQAIRKIQDDQPQVKLQVVTNAPMADAEAMLKSLGLRDYVDNVYSGGDTIPKPHPHVYLAAMKEHGFNSENSVIFEDSPTGIQAALEAGIQPICLNLVGHPGTFEDLLRQGCQIVTEKFSGIRPIYFEKATPALKEVTPEDLTARTVTTHTQKVIPDEHESTGQVMVR